MKRPEPDSPAARDRAQAAAEWLVRRDRGLSATEQDEFLQWLAADPRHGEWFALHRGTVVDFTALAQWRPEHSEEPNPDLLAPPRRRIHWLAPVVLATAAALVVGLLIWRPQGAPRRQSLVADTDVARRILEDGSAVELNPGAEVAVAFDAKERRVTLVRGEALFTVAKNPARPFVVRAAGVDVRAVGTAFSVRLDAMAVEVLVTEGRVAIDGQAESPAPAPLAPALVDAGQQATVPTSGNRAPVIAPATSVQMARHQAWSPQWLDFSSAPLATAIAELNRRNRVQFILADEELAAMPVVAAIRSDNVEGFARFLAATPGVRIERRSPGEIVVHKKL